MNAWIGRIIGVLVSGLVTYLINLTGLPVTEEQTTNIIAGFTESFTILGSVIFLSLYGFVHKIINKRLNPGDTAVDPGAA